MKDIAVAEMVGNIRDTVAVPDDLSLSEPHREELERRLRACRQNPQPVASWQEVSQRIGTEGKSRVTHETPD